MKTPSKNGSKPVRVVTIGGGTGLSMLLGGLKEYVAPRPQQAKRWPIGDLTAVVTVTDDGGSSGRLRREYSILPPGDIRNCMVALSTDEHLLDRLFQYRFHSGRGLRGHSFGNLFLTAMSHITGDFNEAVRLSGQVLAIRGRIFPSTTQNISLEAELEDGSRVAGETRISRSQKRIRRVRLVPRAVDPIPEVLDAILEADLVVLGPGSLYTSVIPNLLVRGVVEAIDRSQAKCVYIANLMTQPGETTGYSLTDHVRAIHRHMGKPLIDWVVVNRQKVSPEVAKRYRAHGAETIHADPVELRKLGLRVVYDDLLEEHGVVRHNRQRLTRLLLNEFVSHGQAR